MKTIIEMAREADVYCTTRQPTLDAMLERFAALVLADEREWVLGYIQEHQPSTEQIASAIRARGKS